MAKHIRNMSYEELVQSVADFLTTKTKRSGGDTDIDPAKLLTELEESRGISCTAKELISALTSIKYIVVRFERGFGDKNLIIFSYQN